MLSTRVTRLQSLDQDPTTGYYIVRWVSAWHGEIVSRLTERSIDAHRGLVQFLRHGV